MSRRSADILVRQFVARRLADKNVRAPVFAARNRLIVLLSIGDQVRPGTYRFHSRFNRVVNFEHRGRLIAVVDEAIGPGPLNIVLRGLKLARAGDRAGIGPSILKGLHHSAQGWIASPFPGDATLGKRSRKSPNPEGVESRIPFDTPLPLRISPNKVLFEGHRYRFTAHQRYDSTLGYEIEDLNRLQRNITVLGELLRQAAHPKSIAFLLGGNRRKNFRAGFERAFAAQITRGVRQIFHGRIRAPDPLPDSGASWILAEPLSKSGVSFPLTPALSLGERENHPPRFGESRRAVISIYGRQGTLSPRERAEVRGNRAHAVPTVSAGLRLLQGIRQLKGCGLGLTPAGDDFIAGLLIGLHLTHRLRGTEAQPTADAVFRAARGKNIFSNTFLDLARRGLLFGPMKDLLRTLVSGTEGSVRRAAKRLFGIGETSGADLATGLFLTLQSSL